MATAFAPPIRNPHSSPAPAAVSSGYALELHGPGDSTPAAVRVGIVEGVKLTIGAGPKCELRLKGPDVRPLHCVVLATPEGPVARRWAEGTLLNGNAFVESKLSAGDRLSLAGFNIVVVALQATGDPVESRPVSEPVPAVAPATAALSYEAVQEPAQAPAEIAGVRPVEAPASVTPANPLGPVAEPKDASRAPNVAAAAVDGLDPAIPRRLLKPWSPVGASDWPNPGDASLRGGAASADESPAAEVEPCPFSDSLSDTRSSAPLVRQAELPKAAFPVSLPVPAPAWAPAATPEVEASNPFAAFLGEASITPAPSVATPTPSAFSAPIPETSPAEPVAIAERLAKRVAAGRQRVASLVAALRVSRAEARAASDARTSLHADLTLAMEAAQRAGNELDAMAERLAELEQDRTDAAALATSTLGELAKLQSRVAELEQTLATSDRRTHTLAAPVALAPASASSEAAVEQLPIDTVGQLALPTSSDAESADPFAAWPEPIADEPADWNNEPNVSPAVVEWPAPIDPSESASAADSAAVATPIDDPQSVATSCANDADDPWGIELRGAVPVADLWGEPAVEPIAAAPRAPTDIAEQESYTPPERVAEQLAAFAAAQAAVESLAAESSDPIVAPTGVFDAPAESEKKPIEVESFIDRFAHMLPNDDQPLPAAQRLDSRPSFSEPESAAVSADDDSIDDYMKKMMERIRGDASAAEAPREPARPTTPSPREAMVAAPVVEAPAPIEAEPVTPLKSLDELIVTRAAERGTDMSALRQLANQSARHNIDVADVNTRKERSTLGLVIAAVSLACGTLAALMAPEVLSEQFIGGLIGVGFGGTVWMRVLRPMRAPKRRVAV